MGRWRDLSGVYMEELHGPMFLWKTRRCARCGEFFRLQVGSILRPRGGGKVRAFCWKHGGNRVAALHSVWDTSAPGVIRWDDRLAAAAEHEVAVRAGDRGAFMEGWKLAGDGPRRLTALYDEAIRLNEEGIRKRLAGKAKGRSGPPARVARWAIHAAASVVGLMGLHLLAVWVAPVATRFYAELRADAGLRAEEALTQPESVSDKAISFGGSGLHHYAAVAAGTPCQGEGDLLADGHASYRCEGGTWNVIGETPEPVEDWTATFGAPVVDSSVTVHIANNDAGTMPDHGPITVMNTPVRFVDSGGLTVMEIAEDGVQTFGHGRVSTLCMTGSAWPPCRSEPCENGAILRLEGMVQSAGPSDESSVERLKTYFFCEGGRWMEQPR